MKIGEITIKRNRRAASVYLYDFLKSITDVPIAFDEMTEPGILIRTANGHYVRTGDSFDEYTTFEIYDYRL